jgi:hypothetical protein
MGEDPVGDRLVIARQVELRRPGAGEQHAVRMRKADVADRHAWLFLLHAVRSRKAGAGADGYPL